MLQTTLQLLIGSIITVSSSFETTMMEFETTMLEFETTMIDFETTDIADTCSAGGVSEDDECYFGDDNPYKTMSCFQYLNGNDCGNEYPGDNAAGDCDDTSQRYRICNTPENGTDACAQMDILTVKDCAMAVEQLIKDGVCDESGMFYSSLCLDDPERPSCVCHYAGSVMGDYTDTGHGNSVYKLTPGGHHHDDDDHTLLIVGIVIGVVLLLIIVVVVVFMMLKNRKVKAHHVAHTSTEVAGQTETELITESV